MSPIDDELRSALASRADGVGLSPDFFTGVERRARRMRRQRVAATVAGSALAVSALGVGGPMLASSLTPDARPPMASQGPTSVTVDALGQYALDPADPWPFRGSEPARDAMAEATAVQWAATQGADPDAVELVPLWAEVFEPSGVATLVFLAREADGPWHWAAGSSSEAGPEVLRDELLGDRTFGLGVALPGDEVSRLLVLSAPGTTPGYVHGTGDGVDGDDGLLLAPREGDTSRDTFRVVAPDGTQLVEERAPEPPAGPSSPEGEGPGTQTPVEVDVAPYALDPGRPWSFRGDRAVADALVAVDEDLFLGGGSRRDPETTTSTPLFAASHAGVAVVVVLHVMPGDSVVTTTWQRGDRAAEQSEQVVLPGTLLLQSAVPSDLDDGSWVVLALASPEATAVESTVPERTELDVGEDYAVWRLPGRSSAGEVLLYATGNGLLYHSEPARRS
jgi:hypothetical protein